MKTDPHGRMLRTALPLLLAATCSTDAEEFSLDYRVKASYLLNLLRFIEWPLDVVPPGSELNLCIYGTEELDAFYCLHGETIHGHAISVERIGALSEDKLKNCRILVMSGDSPVLSVPIARGLLTIGETEGFTGRSGIINLMLVRGRVRFEMNEEIARACGFSIDPKLSKLKVPAWYAAQAR